MAPVFNTRVAQFPMELLDYSNAKSSTFNLASKIFILMYTSYRTLMTKDTFWLLGCCSFVLNYTFIVNKSQYAVI